jgi:hypothetical protein
MHQIETCERLMDYWTDAKGQRQPKYHAQIKDQPGYWACGRSREDAVGELIRSHPKKFGINLVHIGKLAR